MAMDRLQVWCGLSAALVLDATPCLAQGKPTPALQAQADQLAAFTRKAVPELRPEWTKDEAAYAAETMRLALLGATDQPVSPEMMAALEQVVRVHLQSNYQRPASETLEYQRKIMLWKVAGIVATGLPDPDEVAALKAQLAELLDWFAQRLRDNLWLDEQIITDAVTEVRQRWIEDHVANLYYRFDRKRLSPEALADAQQIMQASLAEALDEVEQAEKRAEMFFLGKQTVVHAVRTVADKAVFDIIKQYGGWRVAPVVAEKQGRAAGTAQRAASEAVMTQGAVESLRLVLDTLLAGSGEPGPLILLRRGLESAEGLADEERAIIELLRWPLADAAGVSYRADVTVPSGNEKPPGTMQLACRLDGLTGEAKVVDFSGGGAAGAHFVRWPGNTYRLLPGEGQAGDGKGIKTRFTQDGADPPAEGEFAHMGACGPLLFHAAAQFNLGAFSWGRVGDEAGAEVYEARRKAKRPVPSPLGDVVAYRYWLDPGGPRLTRVVALDADGQLLAETTFGEFVKTADGRPVPTRATTAIPALTALWRVRAGPDAVADVKMPLPARTVVTTYDWSAQDGMLLPLSRVETDDQGKQLGKIDFSGFAWVYE